MIKSILINEQSPQQLQSNCVKLGDMYQLTDVPDKVKVYDILAIKNIQEQVYQPCMVMSTG